MHLLFAGGAGEFRFVYRADGKLISAKFTFLAVVVYWKFRSVEMLIFVQLNLEGSIFLSGGGAVSRCNSFI